MRVSLRPITAEIFDECVELTVEDDLRHFVADNLYSIAQVYVRPNLRPVAIYAGERLVGFTMYGPHPRTGDMWIFRLMINRQYQGNGCGTEAMRTLVKELVGSSFETIFTSYVDSNRDARTVYERLGFKPAGVMHTNEVEIRYAENACDVSLTRD